MVMTMEIWYGNVFMLPLLFTPVRDQDQGSQQKSVSKNCREGSLKLGYFLSVRLWQLFFLQICHFPVNWESFRAFSISKNILSWISEIKTAWRAITIDYPLHTEVINLMFFRPIGWFWLFYGWKAPKFGKLGVWLLHKNLGYFEVACCGQKSQFAAVWCSIVLAIPVRLLKFNN